MKDADIGDGPVLQSMAQEGAPDHGSEDTHDLYLRNDEGQVHRRQKRLESLSDGSSY